MQWLCGHSVQRFKGGGSSLSVQDICMVDRDMCFLRAEKAGNKRMVSKGPIVICVAETLTTSGKIIKE